MQKTLTQSFIYPALCIFSFIASFFTAHSQVKQRDYAAEWKTIDTLVQKAGLAKTALSRVNAIYESAKREKNDPQLIKALVYRMALNDELSDEGRYENLRMLESEISTAKEPARSILSSIAGGSYWRYLQMNRYQFYNRTRNPTNKSDDISTWDISQLYDRITLHYTNSLKNTSLLQNTRLEPFDAIIEKGNVRKLRPTLYDLLAHRALDYFRNDERYITKPAYAFSISEPVVFAPLNQFINHVFKTSDSSSLHYRALKLYQEILRFHLRDDKAALLDADISRISFANNFSTHINKDSLYKKALENIIENYKGTSGIGDAMYLLAEWYRMKGSAYADTHDSTLRLALVEAKQWADRAAALREQSEGSTNAQNLAREITRQSIIAELERVNIPGEPFRILVNYQNSDNVFFKVVKADDDLRKKFMSNSHDDKAWQSIVSRPAIKEFTYRLPATNDYQQHRVEVKADALPVGDYVLVTGSDNGFPLQKGSLSVAFFSVSDISYVNSGDRYYVLSRSSGKPIAGASVQLFKEEYDYSKQQTVNRSAGKYKTDNNGYFSVNGSANKNEYYRLDISTANDHLFLDVPQVRNFQYGEVANKQDGYLFTDRSLYRPGQTVYFKGIRVNNSKDGNRTVAANERCTIRLYDANGQLVDSVSLVTNEFGSFHGKFNLPENVLNGAFRLTETGTSAETNISVEEYKRPKFFVRIAPPAGTYRVNDNISVELTASSYSGANVNGATVSYRVVRRTEIPMWTRFSSFTKIWPPYPREAMEITNGVVVTDADGKAKITFQAIADAGIRDTQQTIFHYEVMADVTDAGGETRSGRNSVAVGYQALKLSSEIPGVINGDTLHPIRVFTTNMSDSFEVSKVNLSIFKLDQPKRLFRERLWAEPDQFILSREEYYKFFPHDQYADELNITKWQKQERVVQSSFSSTKDGNVVLPRQKIASGWYVAEFTTKDRFNGVVIDKRFFEVRNNDIVPAPYISASLIAADSAKIGDETTYRLKPNVDSVYAVSVLNSFGDSTRKVLSSTLTEKIKISDKHKGGVSITAFFVKFNRLFTFMENVAVSDGDTSIRIDVITLRDKILPGSPEKWSVKISGTKGEKVAAELLTGMYDASLDQFTPHSWSPVSKRTMLPGDPVWISNNFYAIQAYVKYIPVDYVQGFIKNYDHLKTMDEGDIGLQSGAVRDMAAPTAVLKGAVSGVAVESLQKNNRFGKESPEEEGSSSGGTQDPAVQPRKNLNETAFFFPDLKTDANGNIHFTFTAPEALTTWKWMMLAHTKTLSTANVTKEIITQKDLMVQPNLPRFVRQGDKIEIAARISNLTANPVQGTAMLTLIDPATGKPVDELFGNVKNETAFTAAAKQGTSVRFSVTVPNGYEQALTWRVIARAGKQNASLTDGEEGMLPVLSNRMLVTETMPLPYKGSGTKTFTLEKLQNSDQSKTLAHHRLTVEYTSNPAWYAVQALPFLTEGEKENAEQVFNRFYANAMAYQIVQNVPRIKDVISKWKNSDTSAFLSNLQKNEELKAVILRETPWVMDALNEATQKENIAKLFDTVRMYNQLRFSISKLAEMQVSSGAFVWYPGAPEDRYMTQYIITGIGRLKRLNAIPGESVQAVDNMVSRALRYLDQQIKREYDDIRRQQNKSSGITHMQAHYLYMRSYFPSRVSGDIFPAYNYFRNEARKNWVKQNTQVKAMLAIALHRSGDLQTAKNILASLKELATIGEELGMYWKTSAPAIYWYESPVETQATAIEAFSEAGRDSLAVDNLKTWLLKNKQTNNWKTTKATADACFALLLRGSDWITPDATVSIKLGNKTLQPQNVQEGSGYFKLSVPADSVKAEYARVSLSVNSTVKNRPSWGAVYWQYFEDMDKITGANTGLQIRKQLMIQRNSNGGPVLDTLAKQNSLRVGDKVKVRIEIRNDRNLEYVHLKDMRAASFEPANVISGFKWNSGLGYYESTKDASTNFYFNVLPKGVHIFEYELYASQAGAFSNGITTIQCMYAPEFSSHSEGIRVNVQQK